jgi:uncharacterized protein YjbI with pentapeptide repeats
MKTTINGVEYEIGPRASLSRADLSKANLTGADLTGAILPDFKITPDTGVLPGEELSDICMTCFNITT